MLTRTLDSVADETPFALISSGGSSEFYFSFANEQHLDRRLQVLFTHMQGAHNMPLTRKVKIHSNQEFSFEENHILTETDVCRR